MISLKASRSVKEAGETPLQGDLVDADHFSSKVSDLALQGEVFGADIVASQKCHTTKDSIIISDEFIVVFIGSLIVWIDHKANDTVESSRADKVFSHDLSSASCDAAAAFDTSVKLENLLGNFGFDSLLKLGDVMLFLSVNPTLHSLTHTVEPVSCIHGEVFDEFESGQRKKRDHAIFKIFSQGSAS